MICLAVVEVVHDWRRGKKSTGKKGRVWRKSGRKRVWRALSTTEKAAFGFSDSEQTKCF
jgi:hypothetical protein